MIRVVNDFSVISRESEARNVADLNSFIAQLQLDEKFFYYVSTPSSPTLAMKQKKFKFLVFG